MDCVNKILYILFIFRYGNHMIKIVSTFRELDMPQLMHVCQESISKNGQESYPGFSENMQILRSEQDFYESVKLFFTEEASAYFLWVVEQTCVAALRVSAYRDGFLLSCLETAPEMRRRGYANALIQGTVSYLSQHGTGKIYSHVDKKNIASLNVHTSCGFERILEHAIYLDGSVYHSSCTLCRNL